MIKLYLIIWSSFFLNCPKPASEIACPERPEFHVEFTTYRDSAVSHLAEGHDVYEIRPMRVGGLHFHVQKMKREAAYTVTSSTKGVIFEGRKH